MALLLTIIFLVFTIVGFSKDWDDDGCGILVGGFFNWVSPNCNLRRASY